MIVQRKPDEIRSWFLVFFHEGDRPWMRFIPGRFKHVAAFAYSAANRTWIVYDLHLTGTRLLLFPGAPGELPEWIAKWTNRSAILAVSAKEAMRAGRLGLYCVPAMAHLVGVDGAVLPDGLWRSCLRAGATIVEDGKQQHASAAAGPGVPGAPAS